ncbi:Selenocysteine-specific translation elongation factor [Enhygromyxa salina]|uniref:Selenocysteine-specific translation elongation factor n=1 Tax=Enhygromyxa salina TaxID=215803 RepID=A0A0C2D8A0_9BACT|nr:selenocysteine-specific translation elongation factor [Enhygromyxa salina]KIG17865.1 Selenocysteine-specific translation elongation factor [Enhygromyxa salina]
MAPRQFILGTAGHIDHGKTSLVRALTGVDTDRLPEEKRRGITIELGFARWQPSEELNVGIVDVPGHEALVRTMVAGAGGIDAVLVVIAAEDGVMPQTREHLHVCELLGLRHAVVALTKIDRLRSDGGGEDDELEELLELAIDDVRAVLAEGPFAEAPILPVSAHTGEGMPELTAALLELAKQLPSRGRKGAPVLPIDRVFTMRGHGTVITGTLLAGEIDLDKQAELELVPCGLARQRSPLRIRGMQVHSGDARRARAGTRTALNLGNVSVEDLARGDVISAGHKVVTSDRVLALVNQLGFGQRAWARDTALQLCAGTASTAAHLVPLALVDPDQGHTHLIEPSPGAPKPKIAPGQRGLVRLYLDAPLAIWAGQRVILRAYSAGHANVEGLTVGGGVIVDPLPERRHPSRRVALARALLSEDPSARVQALVEDAGMPGIDAQAIALRTGVEEPGKILSRLSRPEGPLLALAGGRWVNRKLLDELVRAALQAAERYHQAQPLHPGIGRATLEGSLPGHPAPELARAAVELALERGSLRVADRAGSLARPGKGSLDPDALPEDMAAMVGLYTTGGAAPPTLKQVAERLGLEAKQVLEYAGLLQRNGLLVRVSDDLSYAPATHVELLRRIREHLAAHGEIDVQALKDISGLSRKFVVPFLEHLDHLAITRREGDRRLPGPRAKADS